MTVVKIIELVGTSPIGWKEAAQEAVKEASKTIKHIDGVHLKNCTAKVENNKIVEYRSNVQIAFVYEKEK